MTRPKVFILNDLFPSFERERSVLAEVGAEVVVIGERPTEDRLIELCADADAILTDRWPITRKVIFALTNLKVISMYGVGTDAIDVPAATERHIPVANLPGIFSEDVSEHAIMLLLTAARKSTEQNHAIKSRQVDWTHEPFRPIYRLAGKTLGLVGLGHIGGATARKALGLGMRTIAYDPYVSAATMELVDLAELFKRADHVSLHVPLSRETEGLVNASLLRLLKPHSIVVNTSRGRIINQEDLVQALSQGWIAGAALDVVREDPPSDATYRDLLALPNVFVTPHSAWYSEESLGALQTDCARNAVLVLQKEQPIGCVNPEAYQ